MRLVAALAALAFVGAQVSGTQANWASSATSTISATFASDFAPLNTAKPAITGTVLLTQRLTRTQGTWSNTQYVTPTYTYQWQYCPNGANCVDISGATGTFYDITAASLQPLLGSLVAVLPVGAKFTVVEKATNPWGFHTATADPV